MKKVFFVGAIMCMAAAAFVACKKNNGAAELGGIVCTCNVPGVGTVPYYEASMAAAGVETCEELEDLQSGGGTLNVTCE